jgi:hypothetical protein
VTFLSPLFNHFPQASEKVLDLLDRLLQFHPSKRPTAEEAMLHPYFDSVRSQYQDPEPVLPLGPGGFEFGFEADPSLDVNDFRRLILEEAVSLRAEKALARRLRAEKMAAAGGAAATGAASAHSPSEGNEEVMHAAGGGAGGTASGIQTSMPQGAAAGAAGPTTVVYGHGGGAAMATEGYSAAPAGAGAAPFAAAPPMAPAVGASGYVQGYPQGAGGMEESSAAGPVTQRYAPQPTATVQMATAGPAGQGYAGAYTFAGVTSAPMVPGAGAYPDPFAAASAAQSAVKPAGAAGAMPASAQPPAAGATNGMQVE